MEIKKIKNMKFKITFEYETRKGYRRVQERFIEAFNKHLAKETFLIWIEKQRTMFNAKILNIDEIENKEIIEL